MSERVGLKPATAVVTQHFEVVHQVIVARNVAAGNDELFAGCFLDGLELIQLIERPVVEANGVDVGAGSDELKRQRLAGFGLSGRVVTKARAGQCFGRRAAPESGFPPRTTTPLIDQSPSGIGISRRSFEAVSFSSEIV